jgi:type I restriction-modification system DNA methylase subunit
MQWQTIEKNKKERNTSPHNTEGFFIPPSPLFESIHKKVQRDSELAKEKLNETLEKVFKVIEL